MKKMRTLKRVLILLFLVVVILISIVFSYLGSIGRVAVEKVGTAALSVPVSLDSLAISAIRGKVALKDLAVGNPEGFKTEKLFKLGSCSTDVAMKSLMDDTIVVNDVTVSGLEVTFEQKGMTSNLQALLDIIAKKGEKEEPEPATEEKSGLAKNLRIDRFHIEESKVHVKLLPLPGQRSDFTVKMAPFTLEHVSSDQDKGQLAGTVIRKVFVAITQAVIKTIAHDIPVALLKGLQGSLEGAVKIIGSGAEALIKGVGAIGELGIKGVGAAVEGAGKAVEGVGKGIGEVGKGTGKVLKDVGTGTGKVLEGAGKGVGGVLEGVGKGTGKVLEGVGSGVGKGVEGIGKGIGSLIGVNKKEKEETKKEEEPKEDTKKGK